MVKELVGVFAKFKSWLLDIYQTIKALGKPITPDIRGVSAILILAFGLILQKIPCVESRVPIHRFGGLSQ